MTPSHTTVGHSPISFIADRSEQIPDHPPGHHGEARIHWLALEGTDVSQMKRVVWKAVKYAGEPEAKARWVKDTDDNSEWIKDSQGNWSFITH